MTEPRDPYKVLGVSPSATMREIRDAYRARARLAHPDLAGEESISWMRDLNAAWDLLKDPARRAAHDAASGIPSSPRSPASAGGAKPPSADESLRSREPWTGAAGPPPGRPVGTTLASGIYAGWSLAQVARRDPGYLTWLRDRPEGQRLAAEIERLLEAQRAS